MEILDIQAYFELVLGELNILLCPVTTFFSIAVGPKLKPLERALSILSGDSVGLICIATEGDDPINFFWTKDGIPANFISGVDIWQNNMYSSVLGIAEAYSNHSGLFSCTASNSVGSARTVVQLTVGGNGLC